MKRTLLALPIACLAFSIAGCAAPVDDSASVTLSYASDYDEGKNYELEFKLNNETVPEDSTRFSKDLALFSYGVSMAHQSKDKLVKFYDDAKFDHFHLSSGYEDEPTTTSIGYAFAHKSFYGRDLISVSIRGFGYGLEWSDNFNLGLTGEHAGFAARADEVNTALKTYVEDNLYVPANTTILLTGYSRGGAVANLLAKRLNDEEAVAKKEKIYAYTFECPKGGIEGGDYKNIFNVFSSGDLIPLFAPAEYGFVRYGVDVDVYQAGIDLLMKNFDPQMTFPAYSEKIVETEPDDPSLVNRIVDSMVTYEDTEEGMDAATREHFVTNFGGTVSYALSLFFSLKSETVTKIKDGFSSLPLLDMLGLLSEDGFYNFLKPYVDEDGYSYVDEELRTHCNTLLQFIMGPGTTLLALLLSGGEEVISRISAMHLPLASFVLLQNYEVQ